MYRFDQDYGIGTIDCHYIKPLLACAYIMVEGSEVAFIENNTSLAVPYLLDGLRELGRTPDQVKYVIITHVHLDHAGGSGLLMQHCRNATLIAHPKAGRHMVDPSRLIASSIQVYGEETFRRLYGEIVPVPEDRVQLMNDGDELKLGSRRLQFFHTRGHANHHFCIFDSKSRGVFTGDTFGIAYPVLQKAGPFIYPTSTPTDFDPAEARLSLTKIRNTGCSRLYLTHFGEFTALDDGEAQMRSGLDFLEGLLEETIGQLKAGQTVEVMQGYNAAAIIEWMKGEVKRREFYVDEEGEEMLRLDAELNAQGIVFAASRRVTGSRGSEKSS
jgi:glyoxylase-like metal-dependent hydrolase (beta-lactamase superfamily II)